MLMARPGAERFRMGLNLFAIAGQMMLAGLRSESPHRLKERVFLRLYGNDFTPVERSRIVEGIRDYEIAN
jgi:hypothetical protein